MPRRPALLLFPLVGAVAAALIGAPAPAVATSAEPAATLEAPIDCPGILPVADVEAGMTARGFTVTRGQTPKPFDVEILGVMPDALAPGRDLILVEVSDLPDHDVVSQGGGIWAGMSGSPVYVGDKLLGAISYGFTLAPSRIGGITPAEEMVKVFDYPSRAGGAAAQREANRVAIPRTLRSRLAASGESATLKRLRMPLGVSGLAPERIERLQRDMKEARIPLLAHTGGRGKSAAAATELARPGAGGNFVSALSYGDVTAAATGTTTMVCGDQALAFGHPFIYEGFTRLGANDANSLAIIKDDTLGSFKMATVGAPFGTVDQDRLAAIRGQLGEAPEMTAIRSRIHAVDLDRTRTGKTNVVDQRYVPGLSLWSILSAYDATFDEIGDGTATTGWTIYGTRANGEPFEVKRWNKWSSRWDIAFEGPFEVAIAADQLFNNPYEEISIDRIGFTSKVETTYRKLHLVDAQVSVNGGKFRSPRRMTVPPRALLTVRAELGSVRSSARKYVDFTVRVPKGTAGSRGYLYLDGGDSNYWYWDDSDCLWDEVSCIKAGDKGSFEKMILRIQNRQRNDAIRLGMGFMSRSEKDEKDPKSEPRVVERTKKKRAPQVVGGSDFIRLTVAPK